MCKHDSEERLRLAWVHRFDECSIWFWLSLEDPAKVFNIDIALFFAFVIEPLIKSAGQRNMKCEHWVLDLRREEPATSPCSLDFCDWTASMECRIFEEETPLFFAFFLFFLSFEIVDVRGKTTADMAPDDEGEVALLSSACCTKFLRVPRAMAPDSH